MPTHINKIERLDSFDQINTLSDPKRLTILQMLMEQPRTVSQIGRQLGEYPAGIRYHIKKLEQVDLVELSEIKISAGYSEKYYSAKGRAYLLQRIILPLSDQKTIIFMGSHDLAFEKLTADFEKINSDTTILSMLVGSLDGLVALRQGMAHLSGCHLYDPGTSLYNHYKKVCFSNIRDIVFLVHFLTTPKRYVWLIEFDRHIYPLQHEPIP